MGSHIGGTYIISDGQLRTEVTETPEARLPVRMTAAIPIDTVALVRLRWALVGAGLGDRTETLVAPLAPSADGAEVVARYDLVSLDEVEGVRIGSAEWAEPSELTPELVRSRLRLRLLLYGTARRAWEQPCGHRRMRFPIQTALLEMLGA